MAVPGDVTELQLRNLLAAIGAGRLIAHQRLSGGNFTDVWRVDAQGRSDAPERFVLRRQRHPVTAFLEGKASIMSAARAEGIPSPEVVYVDDGELLGSPGLVYRWIDGTAFADAPPLEMRLQTTAEVLARIHQMVLPHGVPLLQYSLLPSESLVEWVSSSSRARHVLHALGVASKGIDDTPTGVIHGDPWSGNLVWDHGRLAGLLDWDKVAVGRAEADVAKVRIDLVLQYGVEAADRFANLYTERAGPLRDQAFWDLREGLGGYPDPERWWLPTYSALGADHVDGRLMKANLESYITGLLERLTS